MGFIFSNPYKIQNIFLSYTPARTLSISGLKSRVLKLSFLSLQMMVKSGLEFILKLTKPLQRYLLSSQATSANLGRYFCTGQQQLWRGSVNFKINSRPFFTIIFKLKYGNFMTRDFSPLIKRVLAGVHYYRTFSLKSLILLLIFLKGSVISLVWYSPQTCFRATVFGDDALCFFLKVSKTFH